MHPRLSPSARNSSLTFRHPHTAVQKSSFGSKWHARYSSDRHLTRGTLYSVGATSLNQHMRRLTLSSEVGPEATTRSGLLHVTGQNSSPCATRYEQGVENRDGFDYVILVSAYACDAGLRACAIRAERLAQAVMRELARITAHCYTAARRLILRFVERCYESCLYLLRKRSQSARCKHRQCAQNAWLEGTHTTVSWAVIDRDQGSGVVSLAS
jgi:hypothetical protein